ncbi:MAG: 2-C-methyl-D-erythritol 4-phosphate cytidylyltransferase [Candidatus Omnitrophica bacterium]|nr:2-C-methyl-D-erythritol 4-phosphate cytidylyltransferase [Candidatus Omnitrophota bacterium]
MKVTAIVPSAGIGRRIRSKTDKPFIKVAGKEMILYALKALEDSSAISEVIIAASPKNIERTKALLRRKRFGKITHVVKGGKRRSESVSNCLSKVSQDTDLIFIHDAARPFLNEPLIRSTIKAAARHGASVASVLVKPTIKQAGPKGEFVAKTLDRRSLWEAQTPQVFKKDLLLKAYRKAGKALKDFTDDASIVEAYGGKVRIVAGSYNNIKITTPEDLVIAEAMFKR